MAKQRRSDRLTFSACWLTRTGIDRAVSFLMKLSPVSHMFSSIRRPHCLLLILFQFAPPFSLSFRLPGICTTMPLTVHCQPKSEPCRRCSTCKLFVALLLSRFYLFYILVVICLFSFNSLTPFSLPFRLPGICSTMPLAVHCQPKLEPCRHCRRCKLFVALLFSCFHLFFILIVNCLFSFNSRSPFSLFFNFQVSVRQCH